MNNNIINHFFNIGLGTVINVLLGFVTTPYITRVVDPAVYGQLSIFDTYAGIFLSFLFFGLDYALIRFFYDNDSDEAKGQLFRFSILFPSISACVVFIIFYLLVKTGTIDFRFSTITFILLFVNVVSSIWQKVSTSLLRLTYQSKQYSLSVIVQKIVYCLVIVVGFAVIKSSQLEVLVLATIISFISATIIAFIYTKKYWDFADFNYQLINKTEIVKFGLPMIIFALSLTLLDSIDKLFIDYYCSEYEVGLYSSAFTLISMMSLIQTTFNMVWLPVQTEQFVKNPDDSTFIRRGNKYITIITYFIGINVIIFKDIFVYLLGESYRASAVYMPFLILACIMYTISDSTCSGIDKSKKSYLNIIVAFAPCVIGTIILYLLVPKYGAKGASLARALSAITYFSLRTHLSNKYYYVDYDLKKFFLLTFVSFIFAFVVSFIQNNILNMSIYITVSIVFFVIYLKDIKEMFHFLLHNIK